MAARHWHTVAGRVVAFPCKQDDVASSQRLWQPIDSLTEEALYGNDAAAELTQRIFEARYCRRAARGDPSV